MHEKIIRQILKAIRGPEAIAIVHVNGHQTGMQFRAQGNNLADKEAKSVALLKVSTPGIEEGKVWEYPPHPSPKETEGDKKIGGQLEGGKWKLPNGRELLSKDYTRKILRRLHQQTHWRAQALTEQFLRFFECNGIYESVEQEVQGCMICQKVNQASREDESNTKSSIG